MKKTVLLIHFDNKEEMIKIRKALMPLGIRIRTVQKKDYLKKIGNLISGTEEEAKEYMGEELSQSVLVMGGCSGSSIDQLLMALRKQGAARSALKAVLTEQNQNWNCLELYEELKQEHAKMTGENQSPI